MTKKRKRSRDQPTLQKCLGSYTECKGAQGEPGGCKPKGRRVEISRTYICTEKGGRVNREDSRASVGIHAGVGARTSFLKNNAGGGQFGTIALVFRGGKAKAGSLKPDSKAKVKRKIGLLGVAINIGVSALYGVRWSKTLKKKGQGGANAVHSNGKCSG